MPTADDHLHYETIETRARPARVAVLIDSSDTDWRYTAVRIIEFLSSIWGGKHSVIVPTDGRKIEPLFWTILEKFSPDYVWYYQKTGGDIRISRPEVYEAKLQRSIRDYESDSAAPDHAKTVIDGQLRKAVADPFGLDVDLCSEIADRLVPFHYQKHFKGIIGHDYVANELTKITDVLEYVDHRQSHVSFQVPAEIDSVWWVARTGKFSTETAEELRRMGLNEETVQVSEEDVGDFVTWAAGGELNIRQAVNEAFGGGSGFIPPDETRPTAFDVSMSRVGLYGPPLSHRDVADRFALVLGDSLADFCLSYCLPRIGHQAVWLPLLWIDHLRTNGMTPLKSCVSSAVYAAPYGVRRGSGIKVCTASEEPGDISKSLEILRKYVGLGLNGEVVEAMAATYVVSRATGAPTPYCVDSPNQSEIYPFLGDRSVGVIRSPRPTGFSKLNALKHRWVSEVSTSRAVPAVPHVAENLVSSRQSTGSNDIRVSYNALAYTCPGGGLIFGDDINANLAHPGIRLFDTFTAVSFIASAHGFECRLSDKGVYQRDALDKLGGVSEAAELFRDPATHAVFAKFHDHNQRKQGTFDEGCVLHGDKRTYLDLAAVQKLMMGDENAAVTLLDKLATAKVIYRGFVLGCAVCKHAEWYSLTDLADEFCCARCRREQTIRREHWRQPAAPQIFYKLDEIVYQFLKSDGEVVALGLDYISQSSAHPLNYSPEIQFR